MSGAFIAVVGPSGAGKDTLIDAVLARRPDLIRARRVITRPVSETEDFESVSEAEFVRRSIAGGFALEWQAHGLRYAIPAAVEVAMSAGRSVIANLSRGVVAQARDRFANCRVIVVTAPVEVLACRLAARGRETENDIAARLRRAGAAMPEGPDVTVIDNRGDLERAVTDFLDAIAR